VTWNDAELVLRQAESLALRARLGRFSPELMSLSRDEPSSEFEDQTRATTLMRNAGKNQEPKGVKYASWLPPISDEKTAQVFRTHNEQRRAQGRELRAAVARIDEAHAGARLLSAREVRAALDLVALGRVKRPTIRMVQLHLKASREKRIERAFEASPALIRKLVRLRTRGIP
jgi:hypothetical protein